MGKESSDVFRLAPPSRSIDLNTKTLSIESDKLKAIHDECHRTRRKKHLS